MGEMHETSNMYCRQCFFGNMTSSAVVCDRYALLGKGYRRNCPVGYCDKFLHRNATAEEIEENRKLNDLEVHSNEKVGPGRDMYRDYTFGKGVKRRRKNGKA